MHSKSEILDVVLNGLMTRYQQRVPIVNHIIHSMVKDGLITNASDIINDHVAFRTMGVPNLGIQSFEKIFLHLGYTKQDHYFFKAKKLDAFWYAPPKDSINLPRIFVSELRVQDFDESIQQTIRSFTDQVSRDPVESLDLDDGQAIDTFLHSSLWTPPTWETFESLQRVSEYASWVLYNQYYLNHFTITIQALSEGFNTIESFNNYLESIGVTLNDSGGKIKTSGDGLLRQSSTVAEYVDAPFTHDDGSQKNHLIPGSYVEFAQRIDGRDGFDAGNADRIFESTDVDQVQKGHD